MSVCVNGWRRAHQVLRDPTVAGLLGQSLFSKAKVGAQIPLDLTACSTVQLEQMQSIFDKFGSDKGSFHGYQQVYAPIVQMLGPNINHLLEIGIGSNNPNLPSSMGSDGVPGASLRAWREILPSAQIVGADIDQNIMFREERIETFHVDQRDRATLLGLLSQLRHSFGAFDVIIDDGLHEFRANLNSFEVLFELVRPGGFYVVEDVNPRLGQAWAHYLKKLDVPSSIVSFPKNSSAIVIMQV